MFYAANEVRESKTRARTHAHRPQGQASRTAGMHKAGEATLRTSAVCARPLRESAGANLSPRGSTQQGTASQDQSRRGRFTPKPGCDSFCPGKLYLSGELSDTCMQHIRKQGTEGAFSWGPRKKRRKQYREKWRPAGEVPGNGEGKERMSSLPTEWWSLERRLTVPGPS